MYASAPVSGEETGRYTIGGDYAREQPDRITGVILLGGSSLTRSLFENMSLTPRAHHVPQTPDPISFSNQRKREKERGVNGPGGGLLWQNFLLANFEGLSS